MARLLRPLIVLVLSTVVACFIGCESSSNPDGAVIGSATGPPAAAAPGVPPELFGSVRGQLFNDVGEVTPRVELANQQIVVEDPLLGGITTNTDASGNFFLPKLTAGEQQIQIPALDASLPITVFGGAEVLLADYPVDRATAIDLTLEAMAQQADFNLDEAFIIAPHNPIPAGVPLTQALGTEDPSVQPEPEETTFDSPQWLVYVDPTPMDAFHHRVLYFLVDAETQVVTVQERTAYPQILGITYYQDAEDYLESSALVESPVVAGSAAISRSPGCLLRCLRRV